MQELGHDVGGGRSKEDAVAEVTGGGEERIGKCARFCKWAKDREAIGSGRAEAGPCIQPRGVTEVGQHFGGSGVQRVQRLLLQSDVEAGVLHRRADEETAIAARDDVDGGRADNFVQLRRHGVFEDEHVAAARDNAVERGGNFSAPCAGGENGAGGVILRLVRARGDVSGVESEFEDGFVLMDFDTRRNASGGEGGAELARVEAVLLAQLPDQAGREPSRCEGRGHLRQIQPQLRDRQRTEDLMRRGVALDDAGGEQRDALAGQCGDALEKKWIEADAEVGERFERGGIFRVRNREHAGCGSGSYAGGVIGCEGAAAVAFEQENFPAAQAQLHRQREADDAAADDEDVGRFHGDYFMGSGFRLSIGCLAGDKG